MRADNVAIERKMRDGLPNSFLEWGVGSSTRKTAPGMDRIERSMVARELLRCTQDGNGVRQTLSRHGQRNKTNIAQGCDIE